MSPIERLKVNFVDLNIKCFSGVTGSLQIHASLDKRVKKKEKENQKMKTEGRGGGRRGVDREGEGEEEGGEEEEEEWGYELSGGPLS